MNLRICRFVKFPMMALLLLNLAFAAGAITVHEYAIPTLNSNPFQIVAGPDGNLWFTESRERKIGRITPGGLFTEYPLLDPLSSPGWITAGPDGNIWFTVTFPDNNRIARITPNGAISEFPLFSPSSYSLISGKDALWYLMGGQKIGKATTSGVISDFPLPVPFGNTISEITPDVEGNIRFVQLRYLPSPLTTEYFLGKLTPDGTYSETPLGQFGLYYITDLGLGPDGNLWISTLGAPDNSGGAREVYNGFRRLNPDGTLSATFIPTQSLAPTKFIIGPDGNFWFLANIGADINRLVKVTLDGAVTHYETGGITVFTDFVGGPDGNLWLIDPSRNLVCKLTPDSPNSIVTARAASYVSGALAAESIATLFGNSLAPATAGATALPLPTTLAGVSVKVGDSSGAEHTAPLFFVSPSQINFLVPAGTSTGNAIVSVIGISGQLIAAGTMIIDAITPGLFAADATGGGPAAGVVLRVKADGSRSYEPIARFDPAQNKYVTVPIDLGPESDQVFLVLFGSGVRGNTDLDKVIAYCSGGVLPVVYAGAQGSLVGLDQINLRLPRTLTVRGEQDVTLIVVGMMANRVRINIRSG